MKTRTCLFVVLLSLSACSIDPQLHLRRPIDVEVELETEVDVNLLWQKDWETEWEYAWNTEAYGPVGYETPASTRVHTYTHDADVDFNAHQVHNFAGLESRLQLTAGTYDFLFHNNDSEVILFEADGDFGDGIAYTRQISTGLQPSTLVKVFRKEGGSASPAARIATKAVETRAFDNDPVVLMPDYLYSLYFENEVISENPEDYEYIDGRYVYRIHGEMHPSSFIYLIQVRLLNNNGRVVGSAGGAALTGLAESVNLHTNLTSDKTVCVPMDVRIDKKTDSDLMGARLMTFGIPGCNPYDKAGVAASRSEHFLVLSIAYRDGGYKNIHIDVSDQVRALPTGGVISVELDVNDFPPEEGQQGTGGGFNALLGDWKEETGSYTVTG